MGFEDRGEGDEVLFGHGSISVSRFDLTIAMIAIQVVIFVVDVLRDDVELVVVGVQGSLQKRVCAFVAEGGMVLSDVVDFVSTGPGIGLPLKVGKGEVGELVKNFPCSGSEREPRNRVGF